MNIISKTLSMITKQIGWNENPNNDNADPKYDMTINLSADGIKYETDGTVSYCVSDKLTEDSSLMIMLNDNTESSAFLDICDYELKHFDGLNIELNFHPTKKPKYFTRGKIVDVNKFKSFAGQNTFIVELDKKSIVNGKERK